VVIPQHLIEFIEQFSRVNLQSHQLRLRLRQRVVDVGRFVKFLSHVREGPQSPGGLSRRALSLSGHGANDRGRVQATRERYPHRNTATQAQPNSTLKQLSEPRGWLTPFSRREATERPISPLLVTAIQVQLKRASRRDLHNPVEKRLVRSLESVVNE